LTWDDLASELRAQSERLGTGATNEEIIDAERQLGVTLPESYRRFLREFGWGEVGHCDLFGLGAGVPGHLELVEMVESERTDYMPLTPEHLVPIMNDGGGNLYCLDTARITGGDCPVVIHDHELDEIDDVAETFLAWLAEELRSAEESD